MIFTAVAFARGKDKEFSEDSLQAMVSREPENAELWFRLGALAAKANQNDLAKGYFDEGIKVSGNSGKSILDVGILWLSLGRVRSSLPYLMPNLAHLDPVHLDQLQFGLEKEKLYTAQLLALRNLGMMTKSYQPVNQKTAMLAFRQGDLTLCYGILNHFMDQLDAEGATNLLLISFFINGSLEQKTLNFFLKKFPQAEVNALVHLNFAQQGKWAPVKNFLKKEAKSLSYRDYYHLIMAMQAAAEDRNEDAVENYLQAQKTPWDQLRVVVDVDLYRLYASTGNKFKADQIWENLKEEYQNKDPDLLEFMGRQLQTMGYEKQSKYFFRVVLRRKPGNIVAVKALWDDLIGNEDFQTLTDNLKVMLDRDPLSCDANVLAMNYHFYQKNEQDLLPFARNATIYCYEALEPYFILGTTLLNLSRPDEARTYFSNFVRKGGDANRVPVSLRQ
jgi:uncharacterized protein HemY